MKLILQASFPLFAALLLSCSENRTTSDAYGHFESESVIVSAETAGRILGMDVDRGMAVTEGFPAVLIDTTAHHLQLTQLKAQKAAIQARKRNVTAQVAVLEARKKNLRLNLDRTKNMLLEGAATKKQLDDLESQLEVADKEIAGNRVQFATIDAESAVVDAQIEVVAEQLRRNRIFSPLTGTVIETYAREGELMTPGKPLFKVADLSSLTLKVYVSGALLPSIKTGDKVRVLADRDAETMQEYEGQVSWISPEAEFTPKNIQTREERLKLVYAVKIEVKNDGSLKSGMPGEMVIIK
jgi:HlyD family secretion protein